MPTDAVIQQTLIINKSAVLPTGFKSNTRQSIHAAKTATVITARKIVNFLGFGRVFLTNMFYSPKSNT